MNKKVANFHRCVVTTLSSHTVFYGTVKYTFEVWKPLEHFAQNLESDCIMMGLSVKHKTKIWTCTCWCIFSVKLPFQKIGGFTHLLARYIENILEIFNTITHIINWWMWTCQRTVVLSHAHLNNVWWARSCPAGKILRQKSVVKQEYFDGYRKSVKILTFNITSMLIFQRGFFGIEKMSKKHWKINVKISTSIPHRIKVKILTVPAGYRTVNISSEKCITRPQ